MRFAVSCEEALESFESYLCDYIPEKTSLPYEKLNKLSGLDYYDLLTDVGDISVS